MAREVRTGLKLSVVSGGAEGEPAMPDELDARWYGKTVRQHVQEFGDVFAIIMLIIAGVIAWKAGSLANVFGLTFAALSLAYVGRQHPHWLKSTWQAWMKFAAMLGMVMTFLILGLGWCIMMVPLAIGLRLAQKKPMDLSFKEPVSTYWEERNPKLHDFKLLERQF